MFLLFIKIKKWPGLQGEENPQSSSIITIHLFLAFIIYYIYSKFFLLNLVWLSHTLWSQKWKGKEMMHFRKVINLQKWFSMNRKLLYEHLLSKIEKKEHLWMKFGRKFFGHDFIFFYRFTDDKNRKGIFW